MGLFLPLLFALAAQTRPELPAALQAEARVVTAWEIATSDADLNARREAARTVLDSLSLASPGASFDFLLQCEGWNNLPVELGPAWRSLAVAWPETPLRITALLAAGAATDTESLRGALRAAGWLQMSAPEQVEAVAALLDDARAREHAQFALLRITGREFEQTEDFSAWWREARLQEREDWLSSALANERARALRRWEELLAVEPAWAIEAAKESSSAVRRLAYEALRRIEPQIGLPADAPAALALRAALERETDPALRQLLVPLISRFLTGEPALQALDAVLASANESERLRAIEQLPALNLPAATWERLMRELWRAYPLDRAQPLVSSDFRAGLWTAIHQTVSGESAYAPAPDAQETGFLLLILERIETDAAVRARIYSVSGRLGQEPFLRTLLRHLVESERLASDRAAALEAVTGLVARNGNPDELRALLPALVADPEAIVRARAVRSCARLGTLPDLELLAARLELEQEPALLGEMLKSLREQSSPLIFERLLAFVPPPELEPDFVRAVQVQIGRDFGALERATAALAARARADSAYALAYGFSREGATPEVLERHDRLLARTQSTWLLQGGLAGGANEARAQDALAFLGDLERRWPKESEWPWLQAELAQLLNRTDAAVSAMERLLHFEGLARNDLWPLGLRIARSAAGLGLYERGWKLLDALGEPPAELAEEARQVRALFPAPLIDPPPEGKESGL